jgi:glyoxylase-like metal-dependent hydrolase (beta-lactamase superfamily II)
VGAPAIAIGPSIYRIPTLGDFINSFALVDSDGQVTLVDCGLKRAPGRIVRGLASIGKHPRDVTRILLTHAHNDHAGGAAEFAAKSGADSVMAHTADAGYLRSGSMPPRDATTGIGRLIRRLPTGGFSPVHAVTELQDRQLLDLAGGVQVIHTPGHTPGHVSLLHPDSEVLITGDAIFNMRARMTWPFAAFCTSFEQTRRTARILADLEYSTAAFTHGPEVRGTGRAAIQDFLRRKHR